MGPSKESLFYADDCVKGQISKGGFFNPGLSPSPLLEKHVLGQLLALARGRSIYEGGTVVRANKKRIGWGLGPFYFLGRKTIKRNCDLKGFLVQMFSLTTLWTKHQRPQMPPRGLQFSYDEITPACGGRLPVLRGGIARRYGNWGRDISRGAHKAQNVCRP